MSTPNQNPSAGPKQVDIIPNNEQETVTFVTELRSDGTVPPTEWITIANEAVIDLKESR